MFIRNFVVDIRTKNVKNILTCIFQASGLRERDTEIQRYRDVCVCVPFLSAVEGQVNPRDGSIKLNIAPSSPQQPIKQNNTKPNIPLPPKTKQKYKCTLTKNSKQNNFFPSNISLQVRLSYTTSLNTVLQCFTSLILRKQSTLYIGI